MQGLLNTYTPTFYILLLKEKKKENNRITQTFKIYYIITYNNVKKN